MAGTDLEALIGHLFIFGGRSISAAAPGSVAMPAPRRAARGRETETLFALVTLDEDQRQPAAFFDEITALLTQTYFSTPGSVTSTLRDTFAAINDLLMRKNAGREDPLRVGLICAILREMEVYVAVSGPARGFLLRQGFTERLPSEEDMAEGVTPLGMFADHDVRYYRREIRSDDFLLLSDNSLSPLSDDTLRQATRSGEMEGTLAALAGVAGSYCSAQVIRFVSALSPTPEAAPAPEAAGSAQKAAPSPLDNPGAAADRKPALAGPARGIARLLEGAQAIAAKVLPESESGNPLDDTLKLSPAIQIGIAVSVAVLVALATIAVYRVRGQATQYYQLVRQAETEIEAARTAEEQGDARPHYETALFLLDQAALIRDHGESIEVMRREALDQLDAYDQVTRVEATLLRSYDPGAFLRGPIINGLNLYVIDQTSDILYREDLDEAGMTLVNRDAQVITRQGQQLSGQVVGGLIDLAWMEDGGVPQRNVLAVLARNGLLISYSPSWDANAVILPGFEAWSDPRAIAIYNRDLYVLDAGANEIWRYAAATDSYPNTPQRYFTDVVPQLSDAIDMAIDTNGNIYVLHNSGRISKYFFGRPEPFEIGGLPQPVARPTALFLNLSLFDRALFVADQGGSRLYSISLTGGFLVNYRDSQDNVFDTISGVYSQDRPPFIYVTAGNQLFYFARP